ncbi:RNA recognition motif domain-containing protein [Leptospira sp. GIMC2001]|uniref:RNA recognition motif domain-containing protein n=1 Tax=Leptospira sp. GIMC2001 TaxID=1513297 RepID=UPI0023496BF1|nr:RNA-binding protein [Leptospira sp. GIMC2001]WCL48076.1 RNA-binding protein [Leptospira sp. GIMC2001]
MKISYSNFPQNLDEVAIQKIFSEFGEVSSFQLKKDKITKKSLGYGTLEMADDNGNKAIKSLNGKKMDEKELAVGDLEALQSKVSGKKGVGLPSNNVGGGKFHGRSTSVGNPGVLRRGGNRGS